MALRVNGEPTAAAFAGVLTVMPEAATELEAEVELELELEVELELEPEVELELDPGDVVDELGDVVAALVWEAGAPPQPVTTATTPASKERGRKEFFITSFPFVEVFGPRPFKWFTEAAGAYGNRCSRARIYPVSGF